MTHTRSLLNADDDDDDTLVDFVSGGAVDACDTSHDDSDVGVGNGIAINIGAPVAIIDSTGGMVTTCVRYDSHGTIKSSTVITIHGALFLDAAAAISAGERLIWCFREEEEEAEKGRGR